MSDNSVPQDQGPGGEGGILLVWKTFPKTQEGNDSAQEQYSVLQPTP